MCLAVVLILGLLVNRRVFRFCLILGIRATKLVDGREWR